MRACYPETGRPPESGDLRNCFVQDSDFKHENRGAVCHDRGIVVALPVADNILDRAVFAENAVLQIGDIAFGKLPAHLAPILPQIFRRNQHILRHLPDHFFSAVARHRFEKGIDSDDRVIDIQGVLRMNYPD